MKIYQKIIFIFLLFFMFMDCSTSIAKILFQSPFGFSTAFYFAKRKSISEMERQWRNMDYNWLSGEKFPYSTAFDLGAAWDRPFNPIIGWKFIQRDMESIRQGTFNWSIPDKFFKQVPPGLNLMVTINVGRDKIIPGTWQFKGKQGELIKKFGEFVQHVVERYDGDGIDDMPGLKNPVKFWQIENEPIANIKKPTRGGVKKSQRPNLDWRGFAQILKTGYKAIKSADSTASVLSAGVVSARPGNAKLLFDNFWKPVIKELNGNYIDIFDFHWYKPWNMSRIFYNKIRHTLDQNGFSKTPVWMTETAASSQRKGEKWQAIDMIRRMIYPLSYGVKKVFWFSMIEGDPPFQCKPTDYMGIIYDGYCDGDPGYGIKKLAYYSYRQMTHVLLNKDFSKIKTILNGENNIYAYKISSASQDVYVVWWAFEKEKGKNKKLLQFTVDKNGKYVVSEAVPHFDSGQDIPKGGKDIFTSKDIIVKNHSLSFNLTNIPVYIIKNN